jgi:hypothetical protein
MINTSTNKIADFYICEHQKQKVNGNMDAVPGNMEIEGVEKKANRRKSDRRVKSFPHDNDCKTGAKIKAVCWNIEETLDINYVAKAVTKTVNDSHAKNNKISQGIKHELIARLIFILPSDMEPVRKRDLGLKSGMYFCSIYSNFFHAPVGRRQKSKWVFKENHSKRQLFPAFLQGGTDHPLKVNFFHTAQVKESFNHLKMTYLKKGNRSATSQKRRIEMAILAWNDQRNWKHSLKTRLQLAPLNPMIHAQFDKESENYERRDAARREKEKREKINKKRRHPRTESSQMSRRRQAIT